MRMTVFLLMVLLAFGGYYVHAHRENSHSMDANLSKSSASAAEPCECETRPAVYLRSLSCSSTACHGAIHPAETDEGLLRNEYRVWFDADPHANAARILGNDVSQRMIEYLARASNAPDKYAKVYARCLACHNTPGALVPDSLVTDPAHFDNDDRYEGVGCEMCHGKSSEWKDIHYFDCWKEFSAEDKRKRGLEDTKTLSARADVCVRCHIGEAGRDVDHDLIAAGHPQMKFELLGYHSLMPHHWNDKHDQFAGFETELWSAGQRASASAALALLAHRAEQASDRERVWPEFSEYDCFACHHDLQGSTWRPERGFTQHGKRMLLPWGVWHFALLPDLARAENDPEGQAFAQEWETLKATMEGSLFPNPLSVKTQAARANRALEAWGRHESPSQMANRLPGFLYGWGKQERKLKSWDEATQLYLAAYAIRESQRSRTVILPDDLWNAEAKDLREGLGFPDGYQSPKDFPSVNRTNADVRTLLGEMLKTLPE